ncbi:MAG TPA: class I SAM-dependent methyltransferase [Candidatus Nitrosotalea sp.]|nr:class I SAM-dependent methyltransferase [Candidatus Nitrosotalea sp.]
MARDDPQNPDPAFARLLASLPDAEQLEPWLSWCRQSRGPVLYLGPGAGRLLVPLAAQGIRFVGVDSHPDLIALLTQRVPGLQLHRARIEEMDLGRRFDLVIAPSHLLTSSERINAAARHCARALAFELLNPHWLKARAGRPMREGVEVVEFERASCRLRLEHPGGIQQEETTGLIWPEQVEEELAASGLRLESMQALGERSGLRSASSYAVLAVRPRGRRFDRGLIPG